MSPHLSLCEDVFSNGADVLFPPAPRMVFVVHGAILVDGISFGNGETWHGEDEVAIRAGDSGATIWRWDLTKAPPASFASAGLRSLVKLSALLNPHRAACSCAATALLSARRLRAHARSSRPGIRCLIDGGIRIDTAGLDPFGLGRRSGPEFCQAAPDRRAER